MRTDFTAQSHDRLPNASVKNGGGDVSSAFSSLSFSLVIGYGSASASKNRIVLSIRAISSLKWLCRVPLSPSVAESEAESEAESVPGDGAGSAGSVVETATSTENARLSEDVGCGCGVGVANTGRLASNRSDSVMSHGSGFRVNLCLVWLRGLV